MAAITISNLRINPYTQKNTIKPVYGDTMTLTFAIPQISGETFLCGLDQRRVVFPPLRPICAYTTEFTRDGNNVTFTLALNTREMRDYVCSIKKATPIWLQVVRVVGGVYETLVLDDILALPSILDGDNTVFPGDPLEELLDKKLDKPTDEGEAGMVLTLGEDGHYYWKWVYDQLESYIELATDLNAALEAYNGDTTQY